MELEAGDEGGEVGAGGEGEGEGVVVGEEMGVVAEHGEEEAEGGGGVAWGVGADEGVEDEGVGRGGGVEEEESGVGEGAGGGEGGEGDELGECVVVVVEAVGDEDGVDGFELAHVGAPLG